MVFSWESQNFNLFCFYTFPNRSFEESKKFVQLGMKNLKRVGEAGCQITALVTIRRCAFPVPQRKEGTLPRAPDCGLIPFPRRRAQQPRRHAGRARCPVRGKSAEPQPPARRGDSAPCPGRAEVYRWAGNAEFGQTSAEQRHHRGGASCLGSFEDVVRLPLLRVAGKRTPCSLGLRKVLSLAREYL